MSHEETAAPHSSPQQGGLLQKEEVKRADREKQAAPRFPVCAILEQTAHAHTCTRTHSHTHMHAHTHQHTRTHTNTHALHHVSNCV